MIPFLRNGSIISPMLGISGEPFYSWVDRLLCWYSHFQFNFTLAQAIITCMGARVPFWPMTHTVSMYAPTILTDSTAYLPTRLLRPPPKSRQWGISLVHCVKPVLDLEWSKKDSSTPKTCLKRKKRERSHTGSDQMGQMAFIQYVLKSSRSIIYFVMIKNLYFLKTFISAFCSFNK